MRDLEAVFDNEDEGVVVGVDVCDIEWDAEAVLDKVGVTVAV
jgi:hypothetical protein